MELLVSFVLHTFDGINICLIICALKKEKFHLTRKLMVIGGLWVVCGSVCAISVSLHMYKIIIYVSTLFFIYMVISKRVQEIVELFMCSLLCLFIMQSITVFIVNVIKIDNEYSERLIGQILAFLLTLTMYNKIPIYKLYILIKKNIIAKIIGLVLFVILLGSTIYLGFEVSRLKEYIMFIFILLVLAGIIFWDTVIRREKELEQKKELEVYKAYLSTMNEVISDIRAMQHEVDNKLTGISSVMNASDDAEYIRKEVKKYLNDIIIDTNTKKLLKIGHKVIELFILEKTKKANDKQIEMESKVIYDNSNAIVEDYKIIQMLGILIDNAIEANSEQTKIEVSVIIKSTSICIEVINEHARLNKEQEDIMFKKGYSTKASDGNMKRGYGLYNLSKIVNQYKGNIIYGNQVKEGKNYVSMRIEITE